MKAHKIIILQNAEQGVFMKHKRFLSMAALLILALSAVFLVTACPTGTRPSSGSNSGGTLTPPAVSAEETELTALLGKISLNKAIITTAPETITISNFPPAAAGVTAEAASNNIELIEYEAPNQLKVKALPTETADVKITITLTKNGTSKSIDFTVKVFKSGETPSTEDYFDTLTIPTTVSDDFELPKELQNGTPLAWSTENENIIKIENSGTNPKALIAFDIVERKVKLKATVNGKTKAFEVTVLPVAKIEINNIYGPNTKKIYEFTQNSITIKYFQDNKLSRGTLYSYTLDGENKKITATLKSVFLRESGKWLTIEEFHNLTLDMNLTDLKNRLESIDSLLSKDPITIADVKKVLHGTGTDEEFFNDKLKRHLDMEYSQFILLNSQEQTEKIKEALRKQKDGEAQWLGLYLPPGSSTEDMLDAYKKLLQQRNAQEKEPHTYTYSIAKNSEGNLHFETKVVYNSSKPWYENRGHWNYNHESSSPETSWIYSIGAEKTPSGTIGGGLSIKENHNPKSYHGTITGSGPSYTFNGSREDNPGEQITAIITDNKDGTIKVKVTSGGTAESTLTFRGNPL